MVGTPITYRAGDQPNNAYTLGARNAGDVVATGELQELFMLLPINAPVRN